MPRGDVAMASVDVYHTRQGKMFRARVRRNGQTHTKVFATRSEAKQWARAHEGLVLAGMATPLVKKASYTLERSAYQCTG